MKLKKAFTLIELLVVIAIIALLLAIVIPGLRKAKETAKKVICKSNMRQFGIAMGAYESTTGFNFRQKEETTSDNNAGKGNWCFDNGTADYAHEWQPYAVEDIMAMNLLPNREIFFCPSVKISYDKNYSLLKVGSGDFTPYNTQDMELRGEKPLFWSTNIWLWKKKIRASIKSVNSVSSGAVMCEMTRGSWAFAKSTNANMKNLLDRLEVGNQFQHFNVLMKDLSIVEPGFKDEEILQWLWNSDRWAGVGY